MLSDHFLILGCAVLFEMYLLSSCSPIPPTIAWPKPEKNASAAFQKEKGYRLQTTFQFTRCALPSAFHILMLDLTGETSEFVRQTAGHFWDCFQLKISIKPESQWCCSRVWKKNHREQHCGTKHCLYPAERAGGTRVLEGCLASAPL